MIFGDFIDFHFIWS